MPNSKNRSKIEVILDSDRETETHEAINQLITSGAYSKNILNSINAHIIITDKQFNINYVNSAAIKIWNIDQDNIMGKNLLKTGFYGIPMDLKSNLSKIIKEGKTFNVDAIQYLSPSHEVNFVRLAYHPLFDEDRQVIGIILVGQDVTQQIKKKKKQLEYQARLEEELSQKDQRLDAVRTEFETYIDHLRDQLSQSRLEINRLKLETENKYRFHNLISQSGKMREIFKLILQLADNNVPVLITGETGTGKELIAKAIHYNSRRKEKSLVEINCATLSETLLESELFGHVKGAFTGAIRDKKGKFELADQGTIFLDEIGEMPLITQAKLLRVLQEKEFDKVGGEKTLKVDTRVMAATNQNLEDLIKEKRFRKDLFYRLNVININLPPLRERLEDVPLLAAYFLNNSNKELQKDFLFISRTAINKMLHYDWPGNVRELKNVLEKAAVTTQGNMIDDVDIPISAKPHKGTKLLSYHPHSLSLSEYLDIYEKQYLTGQLKTFKGNIAKVSKVSGLDRRSIYSKMKKYKLKKEDFKLFR